MGFVDILEKSKNDHILAFFGKNGKLQNPNVWHSTVIRFGERSDRDPGSTNKRECVYHSASSFAHMQSLAKPVAPHSLHSVEARKYEVL